MKDVGMETAESPRVREVRELMSLLEEHHMHGPAALRTAVECVYGLTESFHRHNRLHGEIRAAFEERWALAEDAHVKGCVTTTQP